MQFVKKHKVSTDAISWGFAVNKVSEVRGTLSNFELFAQMEALFNLFTIHQSNFQCSLHNRTFHYLYLPCLSDIH